MQNLAPGYMSIDSGFCMVFRYLDLTLKTDRKRLSAALEHWRPKHLWTSPECRCFSKRALANAGKASKKRQYSLASTRRRHRLSEIYWQHAHVITNGRNEFAMSRHVIVWVSLLPYMRCFKHTCHSNRALTLATLFAQSERCPAFTDSWDGAGHASIRSL